MRKWVLTWASLQVLTPGAVACVGEDRGHWLGSASGEGPSGAADGTGDDTSGDPTGGGGDADGTGGHTSGDSTGGVLFDVAPGGETGSPDDGGPGECRGVDLLFVIDNSASMYEDVQNLINSFPGFIGAIDGLLSAANGYHVGVATTDPSFVQPGVDPACTGLGVLVEHSGVEPCGPYAAGGNYMTEADDLPSTFACAATLGTSGSALEVTVESALEAVSEPFSAPAGCNEGFIRDDALLVLVLITDEEDGPGDSLGDPIDWFNFVAAQKGEETNVVVLSIVVTSPNACPSSGYNQEYAPRIIEFTQLFTHGHVGLICVPDYSGFFTGALEDITLAYEACQPEG